MSGLALAGPPVVVDHLRTFTPIEDVDATNDLTNRDIAHWLRTTYSELVVEDQNLDGSVDNKDAAITIAAILAGLAGDFDRSGAVDVTDFVHVLKNFGSERAVTSADGDVNVDGVVDLNDLLLVRGALNQPVLLNADALANQLIEEALTEGDTSVMAAGEHREWFSSTYKPPMFPDGPDDDFPPDHEASISGTWPVHPSINPPPPNAPYPGGAHWLGISQYPPNHYQSISSGWGIPMHSVEQSSIDWTNWPPNHDRVASMTWNKPGPGGLPHAVATSRTWNPGHLADISRNMQPHPNPKLPMLPMPSPHLTQISSTWGHAQALSALAWPPGHVGPISLSWPTTHTMNTSILWPGSHWTGPSSSWPGDTDTGWPPNHWADTSAEWGQPPAPVPWFPPDHTIWTTARDILPLVPIKPSASEQLEPGGGAEIVTQ